ncbi:HNH endonuclease [Polaromonas sp. A23]|uniref:HNH endonuclease n=1 Tax=Polaromonas sp. A23 TaxID=1944133 RepID=UPI0009D52ACB|nr:hypothetical protein B0B52_09570 [Polaromonas sp. A23]
MNVKRHKRLIQLRREAFLAQNCQCFYCRLRIWERGGRQLAKELGIPIRLAKHLRCTAEHLKPQAKGGPDTPENVVAACAWCNSHRHAGRAQHAPEPSAYRAEVTECMKTGGWHPAGLAAVPPAC